MPCILSQSVPATVKRLVVSFARLGTAAARRRLVAGIFFTCELAFTVAVLRPNPAASQQQWSPNFVATQCYMKWRGAFEATADCIAHNLDPAVLRGCVRKPTGCIGNGPFSQKLELQLFFRAASLSGFAFTPRDVAAQCYGISGISIDEAAECVRGRVSVGDLDACVHNTSSCFSNDFSAREAQVLLKAAKQANIQSIPSGPPSPPPVPQPDDLNRYAAAEGVSLDIGNLNLGRVCKFIAEHHPLVQAKSPNAVALQCYCDELGDLDEATKCTIKNEPRDMMEHCARDTSWCFGKADPVSAIQLKVLTAGLRLAGLDPNKVAHSADTLIDKAKRLPACAKDKVTHAFKKGCH